MGPATGVYRPGVVADPVGFAAMDRGGAQTEYGTEELEELLSRSECHIRRVGATSARSDTPFPGGPGDGVTRDRRGQDGHVGQGLQPDGAAAPG